MIRNKDNKINAVKSILKLLPNISAVELAQYMMISERHARRFLRSLGALPQKRGRKIKSMI